MTQILFFHGSKLIWHPLVTKSSVQAFLFVICFALIHFKNEIQIYSNLKLTGEPTKEPCPFIK